MLTHLEYQNGLLLELTRRLDANVNRALDDRPGDAGGAKP